MRIKVVPDKPSILITCGPSFEPIDQARRLTNFSTGSLGVYLANSFYENGNCVTCLKGETASCPTSVLTPELRTFSTNDNLLHQLQSLENSQEVDFVFQIAALCDYKVASVTDESGNLRTENKISTRESNLHLVLEPTTKLLPLLPKLFPNAKVVGWKYELNGSREDAHEKAQAQMKSCGTTACVVNGAAYGEGFGFCKPDGKFTHLLNKTELFNQLLKWMTEPLE